MDDSAQKSGSTGGGQANEAAAPEAGEPRGRVKRRMSLLLLDRKLQLTYVGIYLATAGLLLAGFVTLNMIFFFLMRRVTSQADRLGTVSDLGGDYYNYAIMNMAFVIVLVIGMAFYAIVHSHRIAGPILRLRRCLGQLRSRDYGFDLKFRAGDYLHDVAEQINGLTQDLRERDRRVADAALRLERLAREAGAGAADDGARERAEEIGEIAHELSSSCGVRSAVPEVAAD